MGQQIVADIELDMARSADQNQALQVLQAGARQHGRQQQAYIFQQATGGHAAVQMIEGQLQQIWHRSEDRDIDHQNRQAKQQMPAIASQIRSEAEQLASWHEARYSGNGGTGLII